jgi:hypothetical protein
VSGKLWSEFFFNCIQSVGCVARGLVEEDQSHALEDLAAQFESNDRVLEGNRVLRDDVAHLGKLD